MGQQYHHCQPHNHPPLRARAHTVRTQGGSVNGREEEAVVMAGGI